MSFCWSAGKGLVKCGSKDPTIRAKKGRNFDIFTYKVIKGFVSQISETKISNSIDFTLNYNPLKFCQILTYNKVLTIVVIYFRIFQM